VTPRRPGPHDVHRWNLRHPVGTPVRYWPMLRDGGGIESRVRIEARILSSGIAVAWVEGRADAIALSHIEALPGAAEPASAEAAS